MHKTKTRPKLVTHAHNDTLTSSFAIASVGITMLHMLETLLPTAADEVEDKSRKLTDHFMTIANYLQAQDNLPAEVRDAMTGVVMAMQFQDRNSQIMGNVASMLERYRSMLEEICMSIEAMRANDLHEVNMTDAVEHIMSSIRLSDIRARYSEALAKAKQHLPNYPTEQCPPELTVELF